MAASETDRFFAAHYDEIRACLRRRVRSEDEGDALVSAVYERMRGTEDKWAPRDLKGRLGFVWHTARSLVSHAVEAAILGRAREREFHSAHVLTTPAAEPDAWGIEPFLAELSDEEAALAATCLVGDEPVSVRTYARREGLAEYAAQQLAWKVRAKLALLLDDEADLTRVVGRYPPSKALIAEVRAWAASRSAAARRTPEARTP